MNVSNDRVYDTKETIVIFRCILIFLTSGLFSTLACGCESNSTPPPSEKGQNKKMEFKLSSETLWWNDYLKERSSVDFLGMRTVSLDAIVEVAIVQGDSTVAFPAELISIVQYDAARAGGYVLFTSTPIDASDCCNLAVKLSSSLAMPCDRFKAWCEEEVPPKRCMQNGRSGKWHHSIEIRTSFNQEKPWRIVYTASIGRKRQENRGEKERDVEPFSD